MPYKVYPPTIVEDRKRWRKVWYENHKVQKKAEVAARLRLLLDWIKTLKARCSRCLETDPVCLDFHHRNPSEKEMAVATAVRHGWSKARILAEIAKCDLLCANCHRKEHARLRASEMSMAAYLTSNQGDGVRSSADAPTLADVV